MSVPAAIGARGARRERNDLVTRAPVSTCASGPEARWAIRRHPNFLLAPAVDAPPNNVFVSKIYAEVVYRPRPTSKMYRTVASAWASTIRWTGAHVPLIFNFEGAMFRPPVPAVINGVSSLYALFFVRFITIIIIINSIALVRLLQLERWRITLSSLTVRSQSYIAVWNKNIFKKRLKTVVECINFSTVGSRFHARFIACFIMMQLCT